MNLEALASPLYNPEYTDEQKEIYSLMMDDYPEDLVDEYVTQIKSWPTKNPYAGVIQNPRDCDITTAITGLQDIRTSLEIKNQEVQTSGTPAQKAEWDAVMPIFRDTLVSNTQNINSFQDHSSRMISNLSTVIGIIQASIGIATAVLGLLDPCIGTSDFIGSLMEKGKKLMDKINKAINEVLDAIDSAVTWVLTQIQAAINFMVDMIKSLVDMIASELRKLAKALISMARMTLAQLMALLPSDPCLKALLKSVAVGAAVAKVTGVI